VIFATNQIKYLGLPSKPCSSEEDMIDDEIGYILSQVHNVSSHLSLTRDCKHSLLYVHISYYYRPRTYSCTQEMYIH
jgi:hypothetical protein